MRDKIMEHIQKHKLIKESRPWLCLRRAVNIATSNRRKNSRRAMCTARRKRSHCEESQHGFVKGRSCLTNLLVFLEEVTNCIDSRYPVDVI